MRGSRSIVSSFLIFAACSSAPAPAPAPDVDNYDIIAPAPLGESAMPRGNVAAPAAAPAGAMFYARTQSVEHSWFQGRIGRMNVQFELSFSAPLGRQDIAATSLLVNWDDSSAIARQICEDSDLTTQSGQDACSERLCSEMTTALFDNGDGVPVGRIERVIWRRIYWN